MTQSALVVCPHCNAVNRLPAGRDPAQANCGQCHDRLFGGVPVALTEQTFDLHLSRGDLPLVVDFWAPWCGPCRMMAPAFEEAAARIEPAARLVKVNTEEAQGLAARFGIRSIPTLAVFKGGREVARTAGAMDARNLVAWIRQQLN